MRLADGSEPGRSGKRSKTMQRTGWLQHAQGEWWVAAWSGHTQDRVVGPAARVPHDELPEELIHGSYRRHTASIQKKGLLHQSRDLHFHDPRSSSGKWRLVLETCVTIDVKRASDLGCDFRKTGNDVWLCERNVPPEAIKSIEAWEDPKDTAPPTERAGGSGAEFSRGRCEQRFKGGVQLCCP